MRLARTPPCSRVELGRGTGLRMMPTFPRPLPIIPYGGFSPIRGGAFPHINQLKPPRVTLGVQIRGRGPGFNRDHRLEWYSGNTFRKR